MTYPPSTRIEDLAVFYGITVRTLYRYKLAGIDITDPIEVVAKVVASTWNTEISRVMKTVSNQTTTTTTAPPQ